MLRGQVVKKIVAWIFIVCCLCAGSAFGVRCIYAEEKQNEDFKIVDGVLLKYYGDESAVVVPDGVRVIGEKAFNRNKKITSVILPKSVTDIEYGAFEYCIALEKIQLPESLKMIRYGLFYECKELTKLVIPEGVMVYCDVANRWVEEITFPSTIIYFEHMDLVLRSSNNLKVVKLSGGGNDYLQSNLERYGWVQESFDEADACIRYVREIKYQNDPGEEFCIRDGQLVKYNGTSEVVAVPEGVVCIGKEAFCMNKAVHQVILPDTVEEIKTEAFSCCSNLQKINLSKVKKIRNHAFYKCGLLEEANLESLEYIENYAFASCCKLCTITGLQNLQTMVGNGFISCGYTNDFGKNDGVQGLWIVNGILLCASRELNEIVWPEGVVEIAAYAIGGNQFLTELELPETVKKVGTGAFANCKNLRYVRMENSVTELGESAFDGCKKLQDIRLSNAIQVIPELCFYNCKSLMSITLPAETRYIAESSLSLCEPHAVVINDKVLNLSLGIFNWKNMKIISSEDGPNLTDLRYFNYWTSEKLHLMEEALTIKPGEQHSLRMLGDAKADWASDNPSVAFVGRNGTVYAKKAGTAVITATIYGKEYSCKVTVSNNAKEKQDKYVVDGKILKKYTGTETEFVVPDGVEIIGTRAFYGNTKLVSVVLPESVKVIEAEAFQYSMIQKINLDAVEYIGNEAFLGCTKLKKAALVNIKEIGDRAFCDARSMYELTGMENLWRIGSNPFFNTGYWNNYGKGKKENPFWVWNGILLGGANCQGDVAIPNSVKEIADGAFFGNDKITSVVLPKSVVKIGSEAFFWCRSLKTLRMEDSVTELGAYVFAKSAVSDLRLSNRIQEIPEGCFYNCKNLGRLTLPENIARIGKDSFVKVPLVYLTAPLKTIEWESDKLYTYPKVLTTATKKSSVLHGFSSEDQLTFGRLALRQKSLTLTVGEKFSLRMTGEAKATWASSDKSVASVGRSGDIYAKKAGTVVITATIYGKEYQCKVTVQ